MFCHKCGSKSIDGAEFCQKCGAKLINNGTAKSAAEDIRYDTVPNQGAVPVDAVSALGNSINVNAQNEKPAKKKSKKRFFIIGAIILVIIIIIAASSGNSEMDYIKTVKAYKPFANSQGLPYTCDEVFGKYITSAVWEILGDGDTRNVKVSGTIKCMDTDIAVTINVSPDQNDSERALMSPAAVRIGDDTTTVKGDVGDILYLIFAAYDEGLEDLSEFKGEIYDLHVLLESIAEAKTENNTASAQNTNVCDDDAFVRSAYIQKVQELEAESSDFKFNLIDLTPNDVYELVADMPGYYVNVYVYDNGSVIPIMEEWGYGAGGNQGYQYLPGKNIILNSTLGGAGREVYETYMCVDSNNKVVNVYDYDLCFSYPSSYYYGSTEIDEYTYSCYQVPGIFCDICGVMSANDIIVRLNGETDVKSSVSGKILINGRTAASLLGVPINSVIKQWGEPLDFNDENNALNYCDYDGISLYSQDYGITLEVRISPEMCMIDGNTLDKYRDGIDEILGTAEWYGWDEWYDNLYSISYTDYSDDYNIYVYMESPDDKPNFISISSF